MEAICEKMRKFINLHNFKVEAEMEKIQIACVANVNSTKISKLFDTDKTSVLSISLSHDDENGVINVQGKKEDITNIIDNMDKQTKNGIIFTREL